MACLIKTATRGLIWTLYCSFGI